MSNDPIIGEWLGPRIGDLCNLFNGRSFKSTEWKKTGLPIIRIQNLNNPNSTFNYFNGDLDDRNRVQKGDLLFAWSGTPGTSFGAHVWKGEEAALNQHIFKIDFDRKHIQPDFFRYAINQKLDELIGNAQGGVGLRHVTKKTFEATILPLPPLAEQKEIAGRLDELLGRVDRLKARLDAIPAILKRFRQSVLSAATSGKLTEASYQDKKMSLKEVTRKITDGEHLTPKTVENGVPLLSAKDVRDFDLIFSDCKFMTEVDAQKALSRCNPERNDILIVSRGATVGRTHLVQVDTKFCLMGSVLLIKPNLQLITPGFLSILFKSPEGQKKLIATSGSTAQQAIYIRDVKSFSLNLPPIPDQTEIVRRVEELFSFADKIEARVATAQRSVNTLTQSILAKAFRGELTADWRQAHPELITGENSAQALLQKIQQARETLKITKKTKAKKTVKRKPRRRGIILE